MQGGFPILPSRRQIITRQIASTTGLYEALKRKAECTLPLNRSRLGIQSNTQVRLADWRWEVEMFAMVHIFREICVFVYHSCRCSKCGIDWHIPHEPRTDVVDMPVFHVYRCNEPCIRFELQRREPPILHLKSSNDYFVAGFAGIQVPDMFSGELLDIGFSRTANLERRNVLQ